MNTPEWRSYESTTGYVFAVKKEGNGWVIRRVGISPIRMKMVALAPFARWAKSPEVA